MNHCGQEDGIFFSCSLSHIPIAGVGWWCQLRQSFILGEWRKEVKQRKWRMRWYPKESVDAAWPKDRKVQHVVLRAYWWDRKAQLPAKTDTDLIRIGISTVSFSLKDPVSHASWKPLQDSHLFLPAPWKIEISPLRNGLLISKEVNVWNAIISCHTLFFFVLKKKHESWGPGISLLGCCLLGRVIQVSESELDLR